MRRCSRRSPAPGATSLAEVAKASGKPPVQVLAIALERPPQR
ncbi:hypothetical protein [Ramlibacter sp.]